MTHAVLAHHIIPATWDPFVCSVIGGDAGESLDHIVARKEAERLAGSGEFWWGLSAQLGPNVEAKAQENGYVARAVLGLQERRNSRC